jgi:hypothetical protein
MKDMQKVGLLAGLMVVPVDYSDVAHAAALVQVLDAYAQDPAGGGTPLTEFAKQNLVPELAKRPQA